MKNISTRIYQIFLIIFLIGVLVFFSGFYPIALVNGNIILASDFSVNLEAAKKFYESQKISDVPGEADWKSQSMKSLETNIKSAVLQNLIEDKILSGSSNQVPDLNSRLGENLSLVVSQVSDDLTSEGLANLYGWDMRTFKKRVLEPEARRKSFFESFAKQGRDFNAWFNSEKMSANVKIFVPGFVWYPSRGQVESVVQ